MNFEENIHLHVGFYDANGEFEGIFLKQKSGETWCLFFHNDFYNVSLKKTYALFDQDFGYMVREYNICNLTFEQANELFKEFLLEEELIVIREGDNTFHLNEVKVQDH